MIVDTDLGSSHQSNCDGRVDMTTRDVSHSLRVIQLGEGALKILNRKEY